ncbi:MAG: ATP-binding protein [Bacteroidota bacterium]
MQNLQLTHKLLKNYDSAYHYLNLQKQLEDSLFNQQQAQHLNFLRTAHEVDNINRQKDLLSAQNRSLMFSLLAAAAIALALMLGLYLNQRKRKAEKALLIAREAHLQDEMIARLHQQESEATQRMSQRLDQEYQKVARTLHDQLGNLLVTARLNLQGLIDQVPDRQAPQFQLADQSIEDALQAIRQIAHQMHESRVNQLGLPSVLHELKSIVETSGKLQVELDLIGLDQQIDASREQLGFQIIRELTTNVIKYAQATEISLQVVRESEQLEIMLSDNGKGFPADFSEANYGLGLRTIRQDLAQINGTLEIDSQPQHGSTIIIELPLS